MTEADSDIDPQLLRAAHDLCVLAFGPTFTDDDWSHSGGGQRFLVVQDGAVVGHAAVVERRISVGAQVLSVGYVEAVAVSPSLQGQRIGAVLVEASNEEIRARFDLGALSTSAHAFYERLGWERWQGPTYVATGSQVMRTPDEDAGIMILRTQRTPSIDLTAAITCEAREGDDW